MGERHQLVSGECLQSLADVNGFRDGKTIYDAPENADLRSARDRPAAVAVGDTVVVPDRKPASFSVATGKVHRFVIARPKAVLRAGVCDEDGKPLGGKPYQLTIGDTIVKGETDGDGVIEQPLPLDAKEATLIVYEDSTKELACGSWALDVATLAGPETSRGAWQRLANLGYWCGKDPPPEDVGDGDGDDGSGDDGSGDDGSDDDIPMDPFALALRTFQHDEGLDESGELDDTTRDQLVKRHGI